MSRQISKTPPSEILQGILTTEMKLPPCNLFLKLLRWRRHCLHVVESFELLSRALDVLRPCQELHQDPETIYL